MTTLEQRLERMRAFGGLRRTLRVTEEVEGVAREAVRFVVEVLGATRAAIYCAEKESSDFLLAAHEGDLPEDMIERTAALVEQLEGTTWIEEAPAVKAFSADAVALGLRGIEGQTIGIFLVAAPEIDRELYDELVFDVESVLTTRMMTQLRAEELAVLEIQERELVGLLRDVEARDEIIQRDLEEARRFQRQMLGVAPRVPNAAVEVVYAPLGLVGGDLYAVSVDGQRVRLFVADATGHGVRASLTTMFIKSGYEAVRRSAPDPAALLAALNETIAHTYRSAEMLFSAACVDLDLETGRLLVSCAAHPPICITKNGEAEMIDCGGPFLGLKPGMKFHLKEDAIGFGDGVYLYTDGFTEARRAGGEQFGEERFMATIVEAQRRNAAAGAAIAEAVHAFLDGAPMEDDGAFVGLRFGVEDDRPPVSSRGPSADEDVANAKR